MLDVDLIPTGVVRRLRDEKRKPNWRKLLKNAGEKAAATKRATPGLLTSAARLAVATRRERNAARVNPATAPVRDSATPVISWRSVHELPRNLGHGVQFVVQSGGDRRTVAWLDGLEWLQSKPERVEILITDSEALLPASRAAELKAAVEPCIRTRQVMEGRVWEGVHAPLGVFFIVEKELATILAITHLHRHPSVWQTRA